MSRLASLDVEMEVDCVGAGFPRCRDGAGVCQGWLTQMSRWGWIVSRLAPPDVETAEAGLSGCTSPTLLPTDNEAERGHCPFSFRHILKFATGRGPSMKRQPAARV